MAKIDLSCSTQTRSLTSSGRGRNLKYFTSSSQSISLVLGEKIKSIPEIKQLRWHNLRKERETPRSIRIVPVLNKMGVRTRMHLIREREREKMIACVCVCVCGARLPVAGEGVFQRTTLPRVSPHPFRSSQGPFSSLN